MIVTLTFRHKLVEELKWLEENIELSEDRNPSIGRTGLWKWKTIREYNNKTYITKYHEEFEIKDEVLAIMFKLRFA